MESGIRGDRARIDTTSPSPPVTMWRVAGDKEHWEDVYAKRPPEEVSWYEPIPERSLSLIEAASLNKGAAILDLGGGAAGLAGQLLEAGYLDITVADISSAALEHARRALGDRANEVKWVHTDVRDHDFGRQFDLWHDRAVFHFMVEPVDRDRYLAVLGQTLRLGGQLVIATFGPEGPTKCSGLPVVRYSADELAGQLGSGFERVSSGLESHQTPAGSVQQFLYAQFRRVSA